MRGYIAAISFFGVLIAITLVWFGGTYTQANAPLMLWNIMLTFFGFMLAFWAHRDGESIKALQESLSTLENKSKGSEEEKH